jgi:hypothetical protein
MEHVPAEFAVALRTARFIRSLTLGQIAASTGVPTWRLSSFEKGIDTPSGAEFATVWKFLTTTSDSAGTAAPIETRSARSREERRG